MMLKTPPLPSVRVLLRRISHLPGPLVFLAWLGFSTLFSSPALAALSLGIELAPRVSRPGEQLAVEITVTNTDGFARTGVTLELAVPPGIDDFNRALLTGNFTAGSCAQLGGSGICTPGELITWNLATLDPHTSATVTLPPLVGPLVDGATITFSPVADDSTASPIGVSETTVVDSNRILELAIDEELHPVSSGGELVYVLHYGNSSGVTTSGSATLSLPVPAGTSFVDASGGGVLAGSTVEWSLGSLAPGDSGEREVSLQVSSLPDGTLLAAVATLEDGTDLVRANAITEVDGNEALMLGLEIGPDPARPGEQLAVEATVTNRDIVPHIGITLAMRLPEGLDPFNRALANGTFTSGSCSELGDSATCAPGENIIWNLATLDPGQSETVSLPPIVTAAADGSLIQLRTTVHGSGADDRAVSSRTVTVDSDRFLELAIDEEFDPGAAGGRLSYVLHYGNASDTLTSGSATLSLPVPPGTSFVEASDGGVLVGSTIEWSLGSLAPGDSGRREATLQVGAIVDGTLLAAAASLSDATYDVRARAISEIDTSEALSLALQVGPDPVLPGERLEIEAIVTNRDSVPHTGVTLLLRVPEGIADFDRSLATGFFSSGSCAQLGDSSTCTAGEEYAFNLATIDAGQSLGVALPPALAAIPAGSLVDLRAIVRGTGADDRAAASRTLAVVSQRLLDLAIDESADPIAAGASLDYRLTYANASATLDATNTLLRLALPSETTFVSASGGGVLVGDTVEWSLGTIGATDSGERTVSVLVDGALVDGEIIAAQASIASDAPGVTQQALTEIDSDEALSLALEWVGLGGPSSFLRATVQNDDAVAHTGVTLTLRLPDGILDFDRSLVSGFFTSSSCSQQGASAVCSSGERIIWTPGTLDPLESLVVDLPPIPAVGRAGVLLDYHAVAEGTGADDRASRSVPEPAIGAMLLWGGGALAALSRRRRSGPPKAESRDLA